MIVVVAGPGLGVGRGLDVALGGQAGDNLVQAGVNGAKESELHHPIVATVDACGWSREGFYVRDDLAFWPAEFPLVCGVLFRAPKGDPSLGGVNLLVDSTVECVARPVVVAPPRLRASGARDALKPRVL